MNHRSWDQTQLPGRRRDVDPSAFIASGVVVIGDVRIGPRASVWFGSVIRGDSDRIEIGSETNIQDLSLLHVDAKQPLLIGSGCTIGHRVTLHGCNVADNVLVGMSSTVLSGATIGAGSIVAAGSLITEGKHFPPGVVVMGAPARIVREVTEGDLKLIAVGRGTYVARAAEYKGAFAPGVDQLTAACDRR